MNQHSKVNRYTRTGLSSGRSAVRVVVAAGGMRSRVYPALSVALELRRRVRNVALTWVSSHNKKVKELCREHKISLVNTHIHEQNTCAQVLHATKETIRFIKLFGKEPPEAVVAFGGQECFPVLAAARLKSVPYYLFEQNSVPSLTSRVFGPGARKVFFGFPLAGPHQMHGSTEWTGVPVKTARKEYDSRLYPSGFDKNRKTVLVISTEEEIQKHAQTITALINTWCNEGFQVLWQTEKSDYAQIRREMAICQGVFVVKQGKDPYPFYAVSRVVICPAETSILAEIAYFGLPCVVVPGISGKMNYEWVNAGVVEMQGWGFRVALEDQSEAIIDRHVRDLLENDALFETMSRKALDHAPTNAVARITGAIYEDILKKN